MAELATIARPYAEALFDATAQGDLTQGVEQLDALATVAENEQLRQFAQNPKVSDEVVVDTIVGVVKAPLSEPVRNLLRTIVENGRLEALPEVARQYRMLASSRAGVSDALIESAFPIEAAQLAEVMGALEKRFGRKLNPSVQVEPGLIGGIRVVVGDEVLDTSVKARLEQMKAALTA